MRPFGYKLATYLLIAGALARVIAIALLDPHFVDFYCFYDATQALLRGLDPHNLENLRYTHWQEAPLVYPGLTLFFIPFTVVGPEIGKYIFYVLNVASGIVYYALVIRASGLCTRFSLRAPDAQTTIVTLGAFLFVNSIFFTLCIRVGQVSLLVSLLLLLAIVSRGEPAGIVTFGLAAIVKYSTVPVLGLQYFLNRFRFRFCLLAFFVFAAVSAFPILLGHDLVDLYGSYFECMMRWVAPGAANSFAMSGHTMISMGMFKFMPTVGANVLFLAAFLFAGYRRKLWLKPRHSVHEIFAIACLTLSLEYHRTYDGVLVYPVLFVETLAFIKAGDRLNAVVVGCFTAAFALPGSAFEKAARALGEGIGENPIVYLPAGQFPLLSGLFLLLTLYSMYLYAFAETALAFGTDAAGRRDPEINAPAAGC